MINTLHTIRALNAGVSPDFLIFVSINGGTLVHCREECHDNNDVTITKLGAATKDGEDTFITELIKAENVVPVKYIDYNFGAGRKAHDISSVLRQLYPSCLCFVLYYPNFDLRLFS